MTYIYTDGACKCNPGPGGYGIVIIKDDSKTELSGFDKHTTNNRMELTAVVKALESIEPDDVIITSDSQYVTNAINKGWLFAWEKYDWKRKDGSDTINMDLWKELLKALKMQKSYKFIWVKGHNGHVENEICDKLAVQAITNNI